MDVDGRQATLFEGNLARGTHSLKMKSNPKGVSYVRTEVNGQEQTLVYRVGQGFQSLKTRNVSNALGVPDSISVSKKGFFTQKMQVVSYDQDLGTIVVKRPTGWAFASHDKGAPIDYPLVFPDNKVNRFDITVSPTHWKAMMDDMATRFGPLNTQDNTLYKGVDAGEPLTENPIYVPATVKFNNQTWTKVGFRFKGNATLMGTWTGGCLKLPFKLDFDEFENQYPEINDQRFYGVRQFSMYNHKLDEGAIREKFVGDVYRDAGVAVPKRAYYEVYVDYSSGPTYFGLYTGVETPYGETMKTLFGYTGVEEGNIYKPEAPLAPAGASPSVQAQYDVLRLPAKLALGGVFNQQTFEKQNNYDAKLIPEGNWGDVESLTQILNSSTRKSDPVTWRSQLESVFNVDGFMNFLAVNTIMAATDSYGRAPHNYFLYGNPGQAGKLNWVAYDLNNSMLPIASGNKPMAMDQSDVDGSWPLIRNLMDDPTYSTLYWSKMKAFNTKFNKASLNAKVDAQWNMIVPSLQKETSNFCTFWGYCYKDMPAEYVKMKDAVKTAISERMDSVQTSLAKHPVP